MQIYNFEYKNSFSQNVGTLSFYQENSVHYKNELYLKAYYY